MAPQLLFNYHDPAIMEAHPHLTALSPNSPNYQASIDSNYVEMKLNKLDEKYGHFLRYEKSLVGLKERLIEYIRQQA